ncbi:MAG TPA: hypothetical protein VJS85_04940 [Rhizomicrobium sp.]|nr:hypothetical protein [Rhizomicrobium sp.]
MRIVLFAASFAVLAVSPGFGQSLVPPEAPPGIEVPDWALPGSATHKQVAPPADFHRASLTHGGPIGVFEGQTDVGAALAPGSASYDAAAKTYTINSAGYNIWYQRDEFRYLWKKVSGDVSLAADVVWPNIDDFHDRKVALIIRDSLDDDSRQIMTAQHGNGKAHISWRAEKSGQMMAVSHYATRPPTPGTAEKGSQSLHASRIGIEKKGDQFQLWISWQGEPIHPEGAPITFKTTGPFYAGIGFTSHLPANVLTAKVRDVVMENREGRIR